MIWMVELVWIIISLFYDGKGFYVVLNYYCWIESLGEGFWRFGRFSFIVVVDLVELYYSIFFVVDIIYYVYVEVEEKCWDVYVRSCIIRFVVVEIIWKRKKSMD